MHCGFRLTAQLLATVAALSSCGRVSGFLVPVVSNKYSLLVAAEQARAIKATNSRSSSSSASSSTETRTNGEITTQLKHSDDISIWDQAWNENFERLVQFKKEKGHCRVPQISGKDSKLGRWVLRQRQQYRKNKLSRKRKEKLESLGFEWVARETFESMFERLVRFREEFDHARVPHRYKEDPKLGVWVTHQRAMYKQDKLLPERITKLEAIGFEWSLVDTFEAMLERLEGFRQEFGHTRVPTTYKDDPKLGAWVAYQRHSYKQGKLLSDRVAKLEFIGFEWRLPERDTFESNLERLVQFQKEFGHTRVPFVYKRDRKLGTWVRNQRQCNTEGRLSPDRYEKLDKIGFEWKLKERDKFETTFKQLVEFQQEFGHSRVPLRYEKHPKLGPWAHAQRQRFKKGNISPQRRAKLDEIEFDWSLNMEHERFEAMLERLEEFQQEFGHARVPFVYQRDRKLGIWVRNQRQRNTEGRLSLDRYAKLDKIGFEWKLKERDKFETTFKQLVEFQQEFGHTRVPLRYEKHPKLGPWAHAQRQRFKNDTISPQRRAKLDEIQFDWSLNKEHERFETMLERLEEFRQEFGHARVPFQYERDPKLGRWVNTQRQARKKGKVTPEEEDKLNKVGLEWRIRGFDLYLKRLLEYKNDHGHCVVPTKYNEDPALGRWVARQRWLKKCGKLNEAHERQLNEIGFVWQIRNKERQIQ